MSKNGDVIELGKQTVSTIKKLAQINQSLKLLKDSETLKSKSEQGVMFCIAPIEDKFPREFNIYNVREFLSVLEIVEEPQLDFSDPSFVTIRSKDGKQKLRYLESAAEFITSHTEKEPKLPGVDFSVEVTEAQFNSAIKAAVTMNLEYVGFFGDGDNVSLVAFNKNNGDNKDTNMFSIEIGESETDESFKMYYKLKIQEIEVLQGEGKLFFEVSSRRISKVETQSKKTFFITMDAKSEFGV